MIFRYFICGNEFYGFRGLISGSMSNIRFNKQHERFKTYDSVKNFVEIIMFMNNLSNVGEWVLTDLFTFFIDYLSTEELERTTIYSYKLILQKHLYNLLKNVYVKNFNDRILLSLVNKLRNINNVKSKRVIIAVFKKFIKRCQLVNIVDRNIYTEIIKAKKRKGRFIRENFEYFTEEEFLKFLNNIKTEDSKYIIFFQILFYYGLRFSELRGLRYENIKIDSKELIIDGQYTGKQGLGKCVLKDLKTLNSNRVLPLTSFMIDYYNSHLIHDGYLFKGKHSEVIGENCLRLQLNRILSYASNKKLCPHEFRHSCCAYLLNNGFDKNAVVEFLGHASSDMVDEIYFHLYPEKRNKIFEFYIDKK